MGRKVGRAKKKTKEIQEKRGEDDEVKNAPHSFVIQRGKVGKNVTSLMNNMRRVMAPYTAENLKVNKKNSLKDFVAMAGPLNVSHMVMFTKSDKSVNLRIARMPRGPTLHFQVNGYSTIHDLSHHIRKHDVNDGHFQHHALLVMNNFSKDVNHQKLTASMFQNMFPSLNINQVRLRNIKRVALVNYDEETDKIEFRHYHVRVVPLGVSKSVKKLTKKTVPKLNKYEDISQFILDPGALSESEAEMDGEHNTVNLPQTVGGTGNTTNEQSAIRLKEIGPRMSLTLVKILEGFCAGDSLYHKFDTLTDEQKADILKRRTEKKQLKDKRRAEQNERVKLKEAEAKKGRSRGGDDNSTDEESEGSDYEGIASDPDDDDMDDADYYEQEVGKKPDKELFSTNQRPKKRQESFNKKPSGEPPNKRTFQGKTTEKDKHTPSKSPMSRGKSSSFKGKPAGRKEARPDQRTFTGGARVSAGRGGSVPAGRGGPSRGRGSSSRGRDGPSRGRGGSSRGRGGPSRGGSSRGGSSRGGTSRGRGGPSRGRGGMSRGRGSRR